MEVQLRSISTESERILGLEKKIKDLERKNTVAEEELIEANKRYEVYCIRCSLLINTFFRI